MKQVLVAIVLVLVAPAARADTLAQQVQAEAARLLSQVRTAEAAARTRPGAKPAPLPPALSADLQRFGLAASRLSSEIDQRAGPADLRCIFRGMAEETSAQLQAANNAPTNAEQGKALARLSHMLSDAVEIAPAASGAAQLSPAVNDRSAAIRQCKVARKP